MLSNDLKRRVWIQSLVFIPVMGFALFAPAGTLRFWQGWLYGFVFVAATTIIGIYFLRHDPGLIERRMKVGPVAEQEPAQKIIVTMIIIGFALLIVLPGLDHRWHWSAVPPWIAIASDVLVALGFAVTFVVLQQNSYAASTIRVEPGQPVVSTGLYVIVRHPMYAGALLLVIFTPLALGSYWGLLVAVATFPVLVWRLTDEERFLTRNLPGYADYCQKVRYHLVPGVW